MPQLRGFILNLIEEGLFVGMGLSIRGEYGGISLSSVDGINGTVPCTKAKIYFQPYPLVFLNSWLIVVSVLWIHSRGLIEINGTGSNIFVNFSIREAEMNRIHKTGYENEP